MASVNTLIARMRYWCEVANMGYSWSDRWNFNPKAGNCDCSSLVIHCLREAGFDTGTAVNTADLSVNHAGERTFFANLIEFFAPIENQRYILKAQEKVSDQTEYFAVPSLFDKRKEDAQAFVAQIRKSIGKYDLV